MDFVYTMLSGIIGVIIGSILSWHFNNKTENKKIRNDLQLKVVEEVSVQILEILDLCKQVYSNYDNLFLSIGLCLEQKISDEDYLTTIDKIDSKMAKSIELLEKNFETLFRLLNNREIILFDFLDDIEKLNNDFWHFYSVCDDFRTHFVFDFIPVQLELVEGLKDYMTKIKCEERAKWNIKDKKKSLAKQREIVDNSFKVFMLQLNDFRNNLQNDFLGELFNQERKERIYEVVYGEVLPVEYIYDKRKAEEIYNNTIKNKVKLK
ncbi:MAG: hypothetical protein MJA82_11955 [Clostridia bacterium]|nr:hypothetical protein [Clostridia bacterium]